jgi:hypothetical protein
MASRILKAVPALDGPIGEIDALISQLDDGEEKKECLRALGNVMGTLAEYFFFRIVWQYPELDPEADS